MTLDPETLLGLVAISAAVAVVVSGVKRAALLAWPDLDLWAGWPLAVRALGVLLGAVAVVAWLGVGVAEVAVGMLAGAASEVVYRWLLRRIEDRLDGLLP